MPPPKETILIISTSNLICSVVDVEYEKLLPLGDDFSVNQLFGIVELGDSDNDLIADMEIFVILVWGIGA